MFYFGKRVRVISILVVSTFLFLVTGCDTPTMHTKKESKSEKIFKATNSINNRIRTFVKQSDNTSTLQSKNLTVKLIAQVQAPVINGKTARASHLSYDGNNNVYVGYKLVEEPYGGGVDILQAGKNLGDPSLDGGVSSIQSEELDVQEVFYSNNALYVAGAIKEANPSRLSRLTFSSSKIDQQTHRVLSGHVGKSVIAGSNNKIYAISDTYTLYQFNTDLTKSSEQSINVSPSNAKGFRSVAELDNSLFVLDKSGDIFKANPANFDSGFSNFTALTNGNTSTVNLSIARLHSYGKGNTPLLFAALNQNGMAITNASASSRWNSKGNTYYTSVSVESTFKESIDPNTFNTKHLYASRLDGVIDVFQVPDQVPDDNNGLDKFDSFDLSKLVSNVPNLDLDEAQVNHVLAVGDYLYVANSKDGVLVLHIDDSSSANTPPIATDDSDQTTENQPTTTNILANDSDDDGSIDASTVQITSQPSNGTVSVDGTTGKVTYTPDNGFTGQDTYKYTVDDNDGATSNEATVTITVNALEAPEPSGNPKGISFAAFCTSTSSYDSEDVTITDIFYGENEAESIAWTSDTELSTVVLKSGPTLYNYDGGTSGTAISEEGNTAGNDQSPASPCPDGENLIIKDENLGDKSGAE